MPYYEPSISVITIEELSDTKDETLRSNLLDLIKDFKVLKLSKEIERLADIYIEKGVFPERYRDDALHVAIASSHQIAYLISWNFEHLVKVKTRRLVNEINKSSGLREIEIISPQEL